MSEARPEVTIQIDHLFRCEYGKLVSVLTRAFGTTNIQLAEDVVQEAMIEALEKWTYEGVPKNPVGWIYKVARYKAINILKREKYRWEHAQKDGSNPFLEVDTDDKQRNVFTDKEIADDQLRMIFTCCHPSLSADTQVALTLKTLCGFSIPEIASAFLTSEENINKRLVRARKTIRAAKMPFEVPAGRELEARLSSVLETIYLLFNEGYDATSGDQVIRYELCEEAIRLAEIVASSSAIKSTHTFALLALMLLNSSRFTSRVEGQDGIVDLEHQDRGLWDRALITKGLHYLEFASRRKEVSIYHALAAISAHHCTAPAFESTDWAGILSMYDLLMAIDKSPVILLNRAVVLAKTSDARNALEFLNKIDGDPAMRSYLPYYTSKAGLLYQNGEVDQAVELLNIALDLAQTDIQKSLINKKIREYSK